MLKSEVSQTPPGKLQYYLKRLAKREHKTNMLRVSSSICKQVDSEIWCVWVSGFDASATGIGWSFAKFAKSFNIAVSDAGPHPETPFSYDRRR
jgi:hypothetical protein